MLDIFNSDAFGVIQLTDAINDLEFAPGRIGEMGMFTESGVTTTSVALENKKGVIALIPPSARGGPGTTIDKQKRNIRNIDVPHFEVNDGIMAEEVQGIRAFGSETAVETVMGKIAERTSEHTQNFAVTEEHHRLGAIKGVITFSDGTQIDLFNEFGVTQLAEVNFDLDVLVDGALRRRCAETIRLMAGELGGVPFTGVHAFCGDTFFDDLLANAEVRETYKGWSEARILREGYISPNGTIYSAFEFGGIVWENYRGEVDGTKFVDDDKCHMFPTGVPRLFRTYWAPADYIETVNTTGRRTYTKQYAMPNDKGVHLDMQMNELNICTRPRTLIQGRRT